MPTRYSKLKNNYNTTTKTMGTKDTIPNHFVQILRTITYKNVIHIYNIIYAVVPVNAYMYKSRHFIIYEPAVLNPK